MELWLWIELENLEFSKEGHCNLEDSSCFEANLDRNLLRSPCFPIVRGRHCIVRKRRLRGKGEGKEVVERSREVSEKDRRRTVLI